MVEPDKLESFRSKHLLALVGFNPLPVVVAAQLLVKPGGVLYLCYTPESAPVKESLKRLVSRIRRDIRLQAVEITHVRPENMFDVLKRRLREIDENDLGLHYTGGSKAMTVHAYRALERWATGKQFSPRCTYLDADSLRLFLDPQHPQHGEASDSVYVGDRQVLTFDQLKDLHGWEYHAGYPVRNSAYLPLTTRLLLSVYARNPAVTGRCRYDDFFKPSPDGSSTTLVIPDDDVRREIARTLLAEIGLQPSGTLPSAAAVAKHAGFAQEHDLRGWFTGKWLESAVFLALEGLAARYGLEDLRLDTHLSPPGKHEPHFELDVIARRGYQLFVLSCATRTTVDEDVREPFISYSDGSGAANMPKKTKKKKSDVGALKLKAFEARERARQLGGDEARVALVCTLDTPSFIEDQFKRINEIDGGHAPVRVFGRNDLLDLPEKLAAWIESRSGRP